MQTIELDCEPRAPRPDSYIEKVLEGTGLEVKPPVSNFFENWTWDFSEVPAERWKEIQQLTKPRIERLYREGNIRYGSW